MSERDELRKLVVKWLNEAEFLHNQVPDERKRDTRRDGLIQCASEASDLQLGWEPVRGTARGER